MISKTKTMLSDSLIKTLFMKACISNITSIESLGAGEYNAVYGVESPAGDYAMKVAPPSDMKVLSYEKNLMQSEVFWYKQISENTKIRIPKVFYSDFSKSDLPTNFFIMEKLAGHELYKMNFTEDEWTQSYAAKAKMAAQIHTIKNTKFGYIQNDLFSSWYLAIKSMVSSLVKDCNSLGYESERGNLLLSYIDEHKRILENVQSVMVNFDLWDSNVLCERHNDTLNFSWIDPERSFWGDRIADFVSMSRNQLEPLSEKKETLEAYNSVSDIPITGTHEEDIRYAIALGYLALIQETEKYVRYEPGDKGWTQSVKESDERFAAAFDILRK